MDVFRDAQSLNFFYEVDDVILVFLQVVCEQKLQVDLLFELEFDLI